MANIDVNSYNSSLSHQFGFNTVSSIIGEGAFFHIKKGASLQSTEIAFFRN